MKILRNCFLILAVCISFVAVMAESNGDTHTPPLDKTILLPYKGQTQRPNMPSRVFIECFYGHEYMEFVFPQDTHTLSVILYNDGSEWTYFVNKDNPIIDLPYMIGECNITCTTNDGRVFYGMILF